ncbi:hypothetical protein Trydic_g1539 [Trypoxylus dichotomus]
MPSGPGALLAFTSSGGSYRLFIFLCREEISYLAMDTPYPVHVHVLVDGAALSLEGFGEGFRFVLGGKGEAACPMDRRNGNSLSLQDPYGLPELGWSLRGSDHEVAPAVVAAFILSSSRHSIIFGFASRV